MQPGAPRAVAVRAVCKSLEVPEIDEDASAARSVRVRRIDAHAARAAIFGVTCADDVTARDLQKKDVQFTRGKGFDGFCPVGPWIETEPGDLGALTLTTRVSGAIRQHASTSLMIWSPYELLAYISQTMTLMPGDLILTGTPAGVGALASGDAVEVEISGVGVLTHGVRRPSLA